MRTQGVEAVSAVEFSVSLPDLELAAQGARELMTVRLSSVAVRRGQQPMFLTPAGTLAVGSLVVALAATGAVSAQAQSAANTGVAPARASTARPPAKPAAPAPASAATSAATAGGKKLMTRDELRVCLQRNDSQKARSTILDELAAAINSQRPEIEQALDAIRAERAILETRATNIREFQPKMMAFGQKVQAFNTRLGELTGKSRMTTGEGRELEDMRKQIPGLEAQRKALNDERDRLLEGYEEGVKAFAVRAKAAEERAADWNRRKSQHTQDIEDLTAAAADWRRDCADRPFLEDDEKAIRAGK